VRDSGFGAEIQLKRSELDVCGREVIRLFTPNERCVKHENNFDLVRLFAALQVLIAHACTHLSLPHYGLFSVLVTLPGVPIFFVLSGFLVTDSWLRDPNVWRYWRKRALRIFPALWVNIAVLDAIMLLTGGSIVSIAYVPFLMIYLITASSWLAWNVTSFGPYVGAHQIFPFYPSGVLWTLTVELSFYLLLPMLLFLWLKKPWITGAALIAGTAASLIAGANVDALEHISYFASVTVIPYFWIFAIGVAARLAFSQIAAVLDGRFKFLWWAALYGVVTAALIHWKIAEGPIDIRHVDAIVILRLLLLSGLALSAALTWKRVARVLRGVDLSYGIYLWHMLVISTLMAMRVGSSPLLWFAVLLPTVSIAAASWFVVEKPMLTRKVSRSREAKTQTATSTFKRFRHPGAEVER
jgi:peptidoglycan/LPS O-acetylase OafA/YrhL